MTVKERQEGTRLIPRHTERTSRAKAVLKVVPAANPAQAGEPERLHSGDCSRVSQVLSRIGDKWSVLVVMSLSDGPRRFNELKRGIGGVTQRMLTLTLRGLERDGLVTRKAYPTIPPRVDYALTRLGHSLREPVEELGAWAFAHLDAIDSARAAFDSKSPAKTG